MKEEELSLIQDKIMSSIQEKLDLEDLINSTSNLVASKLIKEKKVKFEFQDKSYIVSAMEIVLPNNKKGISLFFINLFQYKVEISKTVSKAVVEYDEDFTYQENLFGAVKGFLGHKANYVKAEEI